VATSLLWRPFDAQYEATQKRLASHGESFQMELSLNRQQSLMRHFQKYDSNVQRDRATQQKEQKKGKRIADKKKQKRKHQRKRRNAQLKQEQA
jgi:hypothetical protein